MDTWEGIKLTQLMSIFNSEKVWKFLMKIQLTKSDPTRTRISEDKGIKCPSPCKTGLKREHLQVASCPRMPLSSKVFVMVS